MSNITLHLATAANADITVPAVLHLIQGLALYEKSPESVEATVPLLRRNLGFEDPVNGHKYAEVVLAYADGGPGVGTAVGMALYFYTFSTWTGKGGLYLEDLFVEESHRGQGIAKMLFKYLGQICVEKDLPRMDWVVLDWNTDAKEVYKRMGAVHAKEWENRRLTGPALARLAQ